MAVGSGFTFTLSEATLRTHYPGSYKTGCAVQWTPVNTNLKGPPKFEIVRIIRGFTLYEGI